MFVKIKKIIKTIQEKVAAFREHAALHVKGEIKRLEAEKSKDTKIDLLCRSTDLFVDRHSVGIPQILLQILPEDEEINTSCTQSWSSQTSLDDVPARDDLIKQKALKSKPRNPPDVLRQSERLETLLLLGERIQPIHEDKILDLSPSVILPMTDTRRIRGRLSRPFDTCD